MNRLLSNTLAELQKVLLSRNNFITKFGYWAFTGAPQREKSKGATVAGRELARL